MSQPEARISLTIAINVGDDEMLTTTVSQDVADQRSVDLLEAIEYVAAGAMAALGFEEEDAGDEANI